MINSNPEYVIDCILFGGPDHAVLEYYPGCKDFLQPGANHTDISYFIPTPPDYVFKSVDKENKTFCWGDAMVDGLHPVYALHFLIYAPFDTPNTTFARPPPSSFTPFNSSDALIYPLLADNDFYYSPARILIHSDIGEAMLGAYDSVQVRASIT